MSDPALVGLPEAFKLVDERLGMNQFLRFALMKVVFAHERGEVPCTSMDMVSYLDRMAELYENRATIQKIFAGEDLRWWPDQKR